MFQPVRHDRFHGRHADRGRRCDWPECAGPGEFRAPGERRPGPDGPGEYRWLCLDHVREFNVAYDFFAGMSSEQIFAAQSPIAGWASESRAFRPTAGIDCPPRWADFADPLEAIGARAREHAEALRRGQGEATSGERHHRFTPDERRALEALGLAADADRAALRRRYSELVRRYHPDRNGGDRGKEALLARTVEAYQLLRKAMAFA